MFCEEGAKFWEEKSHTNQQIKHATNFSLLKKKERNYIHYFDHRHIIGIYLLGGNQPASGLTHKIA